MITSRPAVDICLCRPAHISDNTHAVGVDDACLVRVLELGQMVGRSSSNFAAKMEFTVLFN